jgi:cytochrome c-type biogenesis protein CcmE
LKLQKKHVIVVVLLALSVGLAYDSVSNYVNPYVSVTDVVANAEQYHGKSMQVIGAVIPESLERSDDGSMSFMITDGESEIEVHYTGAPPQNLEQGSEVVVLGSLSETGVLETSSLLVKCPSKYEGDDQQGASHVFLAGMAVAALGVVYLLFTMLWKKN